MAHRPGHDSFDSTTFRRMKDKFNEEQSRNNNADIVGGELDLPEFSYRGKDKFQKTLGEPMIENAFFDPRGMEDFNPNRKYPYLSSRYLINPDVKDPLVRNLTPSQRKTEKVTMDSRANRGVFGNPEYLKSLEEVAKYSSKIGKNLNEARFNNPSENEMSDAIFDALEATYDPEGPSSMRLNVNAPGMEDHPATRHARMLDQYNNARTNAVKAQDEADYYRDYFGKRAKRPLKDNYFDTRGGESF
jgi:hypothetical protein